MGVLDDFARDKSGAQLTMLVAIALLFVSQFFLYLNDAATGFLSGTSDFNAATTHTFTSFQEIATGWELHPHAFLILPVLLIAFLNKGVLAHPLFRAWGWWAAVVLVLVATVPGAYFRGATGAAMGGIAVVIALVAAIRNRVEGPGEANAPSSRPPPF